MLALRFDTRIAWCAHVTVTPEERSKMVFSSGMFIGSNATTPLGGQFCPSSMFGEMLLWKKAQKNDIKNNTSDAMNKIIPVFSPVITFVACSPCLRDSRSTSRHHE